jgi:thiamine-phosphate pyrophosphorylase
MTPPALSFPAPPRRRPFRLLAISRLDPTDPANLADPANPPDPVNPGDAGARAETGVAPAPHATAAGWFGALAAAGVDALQLREKRLDDRALLALALEARAALPPPARLLVNGRADVALAAAADGVHLPADGVPAAALRTRFGHGLLLGVSTHDLEEVRRARDAGADYVVYGPVYATPGKSGPATAAGAAGLARAAGLGIPVYAVGGVTLGRFAEIAAAGAAGVAAIRLFQRLDLLERVVVAAGECFP